jgi:DNA-3-methyladenine glycosylase
MRRLLLVRELLSRVSYQVAADLLGCTLTHSGPVGSVTVELTEVEAYAGQVDPASHAFRGRTQRNSVMFGEAGRLYVYFSYGVHWCCNVVTGASGEASAVLLRAGRVVAGQDLARQRRGDRVPDHTLARGPACLTRALGIDQSCNGLDLLDGGPLRLEEGCTVVSSSLRTGPRVGVSVAHNVPWRFWIADDDTVSAYKRSPRAGHATG